MILLKIWFFLWGLLWAVYFMLDGFDLGLGSLMPFVAKNENEKRALINSIGPLWNGNEVWLITAGGVTFAAFPGTYAVMFSALYAPLMLILFALIIRGVSFEYRSLAQSAAGKAFWGFCLFVGSFVPALLFGVAFANLFKGIPIDGSGVYHGNLLALLTPYGLLGGVLFVIMFFMHGALWLAVKTTGDLQKRAASLSAVMWPLLLASAAGLLVFSWFATPLYKNYLNHPALFAIPAAAVAALVIMRVFIAKAAWLKAWFASCGAIGAATFFGVAGMFPNLLPSSINPGFSMSIHNSASSPLTLKIMLAVALIFVPIVIGYQVWTYIFFHAGTGDKEVDYESGY